MPQLPSRMSVQDAFFLYGEKPNGPLHITTLGIYDGTTSVEEVRDGMAQRMHLIPRYRQRAIFPPLFAGHPGWVDDPEFSLDNHLRLVELPAPATERQLIDVACRITEEMLPRDRPLWDITIVTGLQGDRHGIVTRVHHCMIDGVSGVELALATMDLTPIPAPVPPPSERWQPRPLPDGFRAWGDAILDQQLQWVRGVAQWQETMLDPRNAFRSATGFLRASATAARSSARLPSRTIWNKPVTKNRDMAYCAMPFQEIRGIRSALGGTVNDVVLAVLAGALGRYLAAHGKRADRTTLRFMIPVNVRSESQQQALGNRVSMMLPSIPAGITDPVERLAAVRRETERAKSGNQSGAFDTLLALGDNTPAIFAALAGRFDLPPGMINLVCTNVPGPQIPLYSNGHRLMASYGIMPLMSDLGIGVAVGSYAQEFFISITCDPTIVPDVERMRDMVVEEFGAIRAAAGVPSSDLPRIERRPQPRTAQGRFAPHEPSVPVAATVT